MQRALNDGTQFSGSGQASGSEYVVTTEGSRIMVRLGAEVINGLDKFVILPEKAIAKPGFVTGWAAEGGPSYNADSEKTPVSYTHLTLPTKRIV